ncbi:DUF269 domain-containing protein (plasmid) [Sinorhizobium numidicum]|uniref:DUF269 domain-containing protein n=1 Tax=Sinorhizobium numidicum TaxID=680248 RepID=A0ABY8D3N5_9HYPH|nr:DUF269 domain-containing protein [Sinorhizobium numidicum]WEX79560.1 DUF269 domain-containing protein [Sinorhizobium numidicum]WEX85486.1 DUF269 domain-containing protein [Sinorhizobium numidicum]
MRTPHNNLIIPAVEDKAALATSFLKGLIQLIRAQDSYGLWESNVDDELLAEFIVNKERRRDVSIIGDPDQEVLWRLQIFYRCVGLAIQERSGLVASPIIMMSPEGFGRVLLTPGQGRNWWINAVAVIEAYPHVALA